MPPLLRLSILFTSIMIKVGLAQHWCPCLTDRSEIIKLSVFSAIENNNTMVLKSYLEEKLISPNTVIKSQQRTDLFGSTPLIYAVQQNNPQAVRLLLKKHYQADVNKHKDCSRTINNPSPVDCQGNGLTAMRYAKISTEEGRLIAKYLKQSGGKVGEVCNPQTHVMNAKTMECKPCHSFCANGCTKPNDARYCTNCRSFRTVTGECIGQKPVCPPGASIQATNHHQAECRCDLPYQMVTATGCIDCEKTCETCGIKGCDKCVFPFLLDVNQNCVDKCESIDGLKCGNCDMILERAAQMSSIETIGRMSFNRDEMIRTAMDHNDRLAVQALMCSKYPKMNNTFYSAVDTCDYGIVRTAISLKYVRVG